MACPQCQSDAITDAGICLACGYVLSIDDGDEAPEIVQEAGEWKTAPGTETTESMSDYGLSEPGNTEGQANTESEEETPAWRQELSQRLQAIKQKRESMGQSGPTGGADKRAPNSFDRTLAAGTSISYDSGSLELPPQTRRTMPKPLKMPPRQKPLEPVDSELLNARPSPKDLDQLDVRALIDRAMSNNSDSLLDSTKQGFFEADGESSSDDEGKLILLSRTLSGLVDLIVVILCSGMCVIAADVFSGIVAMDAGSYLVFSLLLLLNYFFYSLFFLAATNQTIGMMITDLRVVDANGDRPSISQLLRRCFGYLASLLVVGLGLLWSLFDRESQCFHDRISDTRVLRPSYY